MSKKKLLFFVVFVLLFSGGIFAQQITRFGVVDTAKVYQAYFRNSAPVRNYENKKAEFQRENAPRKSKNSSRKRPICLLPATKALC